jgi:16S rRNA (adenine(1408)-N(1))-methyltransferase
VIDVGTGDGRYPLLVARTRADTFVIGIDPATEALAHAARRVARDRTPNLALLVGSVEAIADDLAGIADDARVHFPWGSLLRGLIGQDDLVLGALARLLRPGGSLTVLLSVLPRDGGEELTTTDLELVAGRFEERGLLVSEIRALTRADVRAGASSWGKRLDAGGARPGLYLHALCRP